MTSVVEICNMALGHIRSTSINSLEESSIQAQYCKLYYPISRDAALSDIPWSFARKVAPLQLLNDEVFNWAFVYQYPNDCLRINHLMINYSQVTPGGSLNSSVASRVYDHDLIAPDRLPQVPYEVMTIGNNKVIVSNDAELRADYRAKIENTTRYTPLFVLALSHFMASHLAVPIMGFKDGRVKSGEELQLANYFFKQAEDNDVNEQYSRTPDSEFVTVRG